MAYPDPRLRRIRNILQTLLDFRAGDFDADQEVSGADMVEFFAGQRVRIATALRLTGELERAVNEMSKLLVGKEGGMSEVTQGLEVMRTQILRLYREGVRL